MSQHSKFFKVPSQASQSHQFCTRKVEVWLNSKVTQPGQFKSHFESGFNGNSDEEEIEWDDTGRSIASSICNRSNRKRESRRSPPKTGPARPIPQLPEGAKQFSPVILNSDTPSHVLLAAKRNFSSLRDAALQSGNQRQIEDRLNSLSSGFGIQDSSRQMDGDSGFSSSIATSFSNISRMLNQVCESVGELESNTASLGGSQRVPPILPARPFNSESIDMRLAFTHFERFVHVVADENRLFLSESNMEEFMASQQQFSQRDLSVTVDHELDLRVDPTLARHEQALQKAVNLIVMRTQQDVPKIYKRDCSEVQRDIALTRIRKVFVMAIEEAACRKASKPKRKSRREVPIEPTFHVKNSDWNNLIYKDGILTINEGNVKNSVLLGRKHLVAYCLRKIYSMLTMNTSYTKRSIYYQLKSIYSNFSQGQVDAALNIVSAMLKMPLWSLNVFCTGRGLIYGPLTLTLENVDITCNAQNGTSIPTDLNHLRHVKTNAHFIILVEKDSVFQKILADDMPNRFARPFILVTGKGFGDTATKRLLNILWRTLNIPIFILVDADAYGIEIFLNYKFGSKATAFLSEHVALPKLIWFGVYPSEIKRYRCKTIPLDKKDQVLLKGMLNRPYFQNGQNAAIRKEIQLLIAVKEKAEIEGLFKTIKFFTHKYLIDKFHENKFI